MELTKGQISLIKNMINMELKHIEKSVYNERELKSLTESLNTRNVSSTELIDYIENDAEIAVPINELMHHSEGVSRALTKQEYGEVLLKYLCKELRVKFCKINTELEFNKDYDQTIIIERK